MGPGFSYNANDAGGYRPEDNYINPAHAKAQQDYAKAMLYGSGQQPVKHWTQGISNMVNALMGGRLLNQVGSHMTADDLNLTRGAVSPAKPGAGGAPPNPTLGALPLPEQPAALASTPAP